MFGGGQIDVRNIDDKLFIDMFELTSHLLTSAYAMNDTDEQNANVIASTLAMVATTLAELAIFTLEKDDVQNVDDMLRMWGAAKPD